MRKDNYHDYVVEAIRYYALCGRPDNNALERLKAVIPPESRNHMLDLEAVRHMLDRLKSEENGPMSVRCVEAVYLSDPNYTRSRGEITIRVRKVARDLGICTSYVYKALRRARCIVAEERNLRPDDDTSLIRKLLG